MYTLSKKHTLVNYNSGNTGRKYIVIHYTGNTTDTAKANANYFYNVNRDASAHYFIDEKNVVEVVSPEDTAWAVGVNYGANNLFGKCTNGNSISLEMCSTHGKIASATFNNTVELTKKLMKKYNIPASRVVRHYDVCSKQCPGWSGWLGSDNSIWKKFKQAISTNSISTYLIKSNAGGYAKNEADPRGNSSKKQITIPKGARVSVIKDDGCGWSKVIYQKKSYWISNSHLQKDNKSTYPTITIKAGKTVRRLSKDGKTFETKTVLKKDIKCKMISLITSGAYKGYYYLRLISKDEHDGRYYYCKK